MTANSLPAANQTAMYREAREAADAVARQLARNDAVVTRLAARLRASPPRFVATSARGSSDHAATFAKYVFETQLGCATMSASPSISSVYATALHLEGALYLAISQSGKSPDLVRQAEHARQSGAHVVAMVNVEDSPLAAAADDVVPLCAGPETSVAATKSYICALSAIVHVASAWKQDGALRTALAGVLAAQDAYDHVVDGRFKGGYITRHYGRPEEDVHAVQLEMTWACYMDEEPPYKYRADRAVEVTPVLTELLRTMRDWRPA